MYEEAHDGVTLHSSGIFYVRNNLVTALRQFRNSYEDVILWCDAMCINQADVTEKNVQVARMHEIYSAANYVCVWLGTETDDAIETFDFLRSLLVLQHLDQAARLRTSQSQRIWLLVVKLMKNQWFTRRWVIQELVLAKKAQVCFGTAEMEWSKFVEAISLLMTKHNQIKEIIGTTASFSTIQDPDAHFGAMELRALSATTFVDATSYLLSWAEHGKVRRKLMSLEFLVTSQFPISVFQASEPRDTIYALLSLAKDAPDTMDLIHPRKPYIPPMSGSVAEIVQIILHGCYLVAHWIWIIFTYFRNVFEKSELHISKLITPDYNKSSIDACADFMEYCIKTSHSLDIICRHWTVQPKTPTSLELMLNQRKPPVEEKMPSWIQSMEGHAYGGPRGVFDGRTNGDSLVGSLGALNKKPYTASGNLQPWSKFGKYKSTKNVAIMVEQESNMITDATQFAPQKFHRKLHLKGLELGTIEKTTERVRHGVIPAEAFEYGGWPAVGSLSFLPPDKVPDQLWRTLVADRGPNGINCPMWYRLACLECLLHGNANGDFNTNEIRGFHDTPETMKLFLSRLQAVIWNRRFFLSKATEEQPPLYGLAPPRTMSGDKICILFGCSVPVILRKFQENGLSNDDYTFVGECYVNGKMGWRGPSKKDAEVPL